MENCLDDMSDAQLLQLAQSPDEHAINCLLRRYTALVRSVAVGYNINGAVLDDIIQEGMVGLYNAILRYDDKREASFPTFARLCIQNSIVSMARSANALKESPHNSAISLDDEIAGLQFSLTADPMTNPENVVMAQDTFNGTLTALKELLSPLEHKVLMEHLSGKSYAEIARSIGRSTKSVDNTLTRIRKKVRDYTKNQY